MPSCTAEVGRESGHQPRLRRRRRLLSASRATYGHGCEDLLLLERERRGRSDRKRLRAGPLGLLSRQGKVSGEDAYRRILQVWLDSFPIRTMSVQSKSLWRA